MATKNDAVILVLKDKIEAKRANLNNPGKFAPVTTCIFTLYGDKVNIHTMDVSRVQQYLIHFKTMIDACSDIPDLEADKVMIDGFSLREWYNDLLLKYQIMNYEAEVKELKALEAKLDKLLSSDKKVELELAEIAALIGD